VHSVDNWHLHDGVISLQLPEYFVFSVSYAIRSVGCKGYGSIGPMVRPRRQSITQPVGQKRQ